MELIIAAAAIAVNLLVLYFIVRKATRADEQIALLSQILAANNRQPKSDIVLLTEERQKRGAK